MNTRKRMLVFSEGSGMPVQISGNGPTAQFDEAVLSTLRMSDPALSDLVLGYTNAESVRKVLFPEFTVVKEAGKVPGVGREAFQRHNVSRAVQGETNRMGFKTGSIAFSLNEDSLGFMIDDREVEEWAVPRDNLKVIRQTVVNQALDLAQELNAATLATTSANYAAGMASNTSPVTAGAFDWAGAGDPVKDLLEQRELVRKQIGRYPTVGLFDPTAWRLFRTNSAALSYFSKFVSGSGPENLIITEKLAAVVLELKEVVVGKGVYTTSVAAGFGDNPAMNDIWSTVQTGNAVLAYTGIGMQEPTYGIKFVKKGYPQATTYRWEPTHSDVYEVQHIYQQLINIQQAGALLYGIS